MRHLAEAPAPDMKKTYSQVVQLSIWIAKGQAPGKDRDLLLVDLWLRSGDEIQGLKVQNLFLHPQRQPGVAIGELLPNNAGGVFYIFADPVTCNYHLASQKLECGL